jgi:hypothetical protein
MHVHELQGKGEEGWTIMVMRGCKATVRGVCGTHALDLLCRGVLHYTVQLNITLKHVKFNDYLQ